MTPDGRTGHSLINRNTINKTHKHLHLPQRLTIISQHRLSFKVTGAQRPPFILKKNISLGLQCPLGYFMATVRVPRGQPADTTDTYCLLLNYFFCLHESIKRKHFDMQSRSASRGGKKFSPNFPFCICNTEWMSQKLCCEWNS